MDKRSRRRFTKEFKAETVALVRHSGKSIAEICRDMGLPESSVHRWLAQAKIDGGQRDGLMDVAIDLAAGHYPPVRRLVFRNLAKHQSELPWDAVRPVDWRRRRIVTSDLTTGRVSPFGGTGSSGSAHA